MIDDPILEKRLRKIEALFAGAATTGDSKVSRGRRIWRSIHF